jgi:hypothetical protein
LIEKFYSTFFEQNCEIGNNNCIDYKYTDCKEKENTKTSLFSCVCNDEYFWEENFVELPTEDPESDEKAHESTCKGIYECSFSILWHLNL